MMEQKFIAGIYCRLSKDDDRPGESMSIETQRAMLTEYCVKNNLEIFDVYVDDGFSGTNFEREAFQRLLNDIDAGTVNMVLTKDTGLLAFSKIGSVVSDNYWSVTPDKIWLRTPDANRSKQQSINAQKEAILLPVKRLMDIKRPPGILRSTRKQHETCD